MEKKGLVVKMSYDFETASNLEVHIPNSTYGWYRVTSREFRSFNGKRRINGIEYNGPVFLFNTNKRVNKSQYDKNKYAGYKYKSQLTGAEAFRE